MDRTESRRTRRALPARALSGPIGTPDETLNKTFVEKGATMVDAVCLLVGCGVGLMLGLLGALPPALKALRMPVAESLKSI